MQERVHGQVLVNFCICYCWGVNIIKESERVGEEGNTSTVYVLRHVSKQ